MDDKDNLFNILSNKITRSFPGNRGISYILAAFKLRANCTLTFENCTHKLHSNCNLKVQTALCSLRLQSFFGNLALWQIKVFMYLHSYCLVASFLKMLEIVLKKNTTFRTIGAMKLLISIANISICLHEKHYFWYRRPPIGTVSIDKF